MSVDKFGRSPVGSSTTSGVSIRYINENFFRIDGTSLATGPLNMNGNRISNVVDPIDKQDVATKNYIEDSTVSKSGAIMTGPLTIEGQAGDATILNDRKGISVSGGNIAVGREAGGPEIDIRQSGDVYSSGIRIRNSADDKHCQLGWANNKFSLHQVDMGEPGNKIFSVSNSRLRELEDPIGRQDAATKAYVDNAVKKPIIAVWAEQKGPLTAGNYEWSFGNGGDGNTHRHIGYCVPAAGRILRMSLSCAYTANDVSVAIIVNGSGQDSQYSVTVSSGQYSNFSIFRVPLSLPEGSRINFKTIASDSRVENAVVSVLIELDL